MARIQCRTVLCYTFLFIVVSVHLCLQYAWPVPESSGPPSTSVLSDAAVGDVRMMKHLKAQRDGRKTDTSAPSMVYGDRENTENVIREHIPKAKSPIRYAKITNLHVSKNNETGRLPVENLNRKRLVDNQDKMKFPWKYQFNCSNIPSIVVRHKIGHGVTKQVNKGIYRGDQQVAVKMVTRNQYDVITCLKKLNRDDGMVSPHEKSKCFIFPNMKLMKEILLLDQLNHSNLLKMLGYCVRSEENLSTSLEDHGVIAIYEYGMRFYMSTLQQWSWLKKLDVMVQLADLLIYFENSPLGSLRISDFKEEHFLRVGDQIKLTDMDDVTAAEPKCDMTSYLSTYEEPKGCTYKIRCTAGICPGSNAKHNLANMNRIFFRNLLRFDGEEDTQRKTEYLQQRLDNLDITARELKDILSELRDIASSDSFSYHL